MLLMNYLYHHADTTSGSYLFCEIYNPDGKCVFYRIFNGTADVQSICIYSEMSSPTSVILRVSVLSADGQELHGELLSGSDCLDVPTDVTYQLQIVASAYSSSIYATQWAKIGSIEFQSEKYTLDSSGKSQPFSDILTGRAKRKRWIFFEGILLCGSVLAHKLLQ
jgi:hypothetical protein